MERGAVARLALEFRRERGSQPARLIVENGDGAGYSRRNRRGPTKVDQKVWPADVSRRMFLGSSAAAVLTAPFAANAVPASDKITVGMIGLGFRGSLLLERLYARAKEIGRASCRERV